MSELGESQTELLEKPWPHAAAWEQPSSQWGQSPRGGGSQGRASQGQRPHTWDWSLHVAPGAASRCLPSGPSEMAFPKPGYQPHSPPQLAKTLTLHPPWLCGSVGSYSDLSNLCLKFVASLALGWVPRSSVYLRAVHNFVLAGHLQADLCPCLAYLLPAILPSSL